MSTKKPKTRRNTRRDKAIARILAAARTVVEDIGIAELTTEEVARVAGVSKPSVYYYFASKEDLVRSLAEELAIEEATALRRLVEEAPPGPAVLEALVRGFVAHHRDRLEFFRVEYLWSQVVGLEPGRADEAVNPTMIALFGALEQRLGQEQEAGRLRATLHPRRLAVSVWMAAHGLVATVALLASGGDQLTHDLDVMVDDLCAVLVHGAFRDPEG